jgi:hemerythrin-like domain-containing protein
MTDTSPLTDFSNCHGGILRRLNQLGELPALLTPAAQARRLAQDSLAFFREAVFEHHADEERELFPAVLTAATAGEERERVRHLTELLAREHRQIEGLWKHLEPGLKKVAKGQDSDLDGAEVVRLVQIYTAHAQFEETEFLPLAHTLLARKAHSLQALSLSLHLRHAPQVVGYV